MKLHKWVLGQSLYLINLLTPKGRIGIVKFYIDPDPHPDLIFWKMGIEIFLKHEFWAYNKRKKGKHNNISHGSFRNFFSL